MSPVLGTAAAWARRHSPMSESPLYERAYILYIFCFLLLCHTFLFTHAVLSTFLSPFPLSLLSNNNDNFFNFLSNIVAMQSVRLTWPRWTSTHCLLTAATRSPLCSGGHTQFPHSQHTYTRTRTHIHTYTHHTHSVFSYRRHLQPLWCSGGLFIANHPHTHNTHTHAHAHARAHIHAYTRTYTYTHTFITLTHCITTAAPFGGV